MRSERARNLHSSISSTSLNSELHYPSSQLLDRVELASPPSSYSRDISSDLTVSTSQLLYSSF